MVKRMAIQEENMIRRLYSCWYGKIILAILIIILVFVFCNSLIMPWYTRHGYEVEVPDVLHLSSDAAEKILAHNGFRIVRGKITHDAYYPPGFVLFQNPEAGAKVKKGRRVYVTVSRGERVVAMPKLIDLNLSNTRHTLKSWELVLGDVELKFNSQFEDTIVIFQSVAIGADVTVGTEIHLTCKVRPLHESTVPSIVGSSLIEAKEKLRDAKLILGKVVYQVTDQLLPLTVIEQQPEAGFVTLMGDTVTLVVSKLPEPEKIQGSDTTKYW